MNAKHLFYLIRVLALVVPGGMGISSATAASLELGSPFLDNAILQRGMPVPVWGWAEPGNTVTVHFGDQAKSATADTRGKWMLNLNVLDASAVERELKVSSAGEAITRKGILVGEVWFSSGQSNMDWLAGKSKCAKIASDLQRAEKEVPIREYNADMGSSLFLRSRVASEAGWKSSRSASSFSALSLAFAYDLHHELQVPIGIVRSTHGATPVETWAAREGFSDHPMLQDIARQIQESDPGTPEGQAAYERYYEELKAWQVESAQLIERGGQALPRPQLPGIAEEWKGASRMYNHKIAPLVPYAIRGAIWCQGESNADDGKIYAAKMEALINGWRLHWGRPDMPFYFTQLQCYGEPNPDNVGFADLREAQTLFFLNNKNVGMVAQHDLNSERPTGIHYYNKLDPGKRLARWALHHQYGKKDLAYVGPIYTSHKVDDAEVRVQFEQRGPGGGLMVGSKGLQADIKQDPKAYVEPARETPGEALQHFRLAGKDKVWHSAEALIVNEHEVLITSQAVPKPVGVQYAYSASPIGANLYNRAGLPALPFALFDGKPLFNEDDPAIVAAAKADAERRYGKKSYLLPATLFRDHAVIQCERPVPVWGHGIPGSEITVRFGGQEKKTVVGEFEYWKVHLDPMPASGLGRDLEIRSNAGEERIVRDLLVGDVWIMTGTRSLSEQVIRINKDEQNTLEPLPLVREFRMKTNARRFRTPRKLRMEIGGGKYVAAWKAVAFDRAEDNPSVAGYHFAAQVHRPGVPVGIVSLGSENPPLTWVSYAGMQQASGFEKERDDLNLAYPNTDSCRQAVEKYTEAVKAYTGEIAKLRKAGDEIPAELAEKSPPFPQPYYNQWESRTETPTHTYNFCISPITPCAVRGVAWIPGKDNIGNDASRYAPSLEVYAASLAETYGQKTVRFVYAQPADDLLRPAPAEGVHGIGKPRIAHAVEFAAWPKSLEDLATQLGAAASALK